MWTILKRLSSWHRPLPRRVAIRVDDERVILTQAGREEPLSFQWADVDRIEAYKRDLLTTDLICLAFHVSRLHYELCEEDEGFQQLVEQMEVKFQPIEPDWYFTVMHPPFATNQCTLWKRG